MPAIQPKRIAQIAITVRDLERAKNFYASILGLTHLFDAPPGLCFFQCGETRLMLSQPEGPESSGNSILYYGVDSARKGPAGPGWIWMAGALAGASGAGAVGGGAGCCPDPVGAGAGRSSSAHVPDGA